MSAPPDLELAKTFIDEFLDSELGFNDERTNRQALWLVSAILTGEWIEYSEESEKKLMSVPCGKLLEPYFDPWAWSTEELNALKVAHRLTQTP